MPAAGRDHAPDGSGGIPRDAAANREDPTDWYVPGLDTAGFASTDRNPTDCDAGDCAGTDHNSSDSDAGGCPSTNHNSSDSDAGGCSGTDHNSSDSEAGDCAGTDRNSSDSEVADRGCAARGDLAVDRAHTTGQEGPGKPSSAP